MNELVYFLSRALNLDKSNKKHKFEKPLEFYKSEIFEILGKIDEKSENITPEFYPSMFSSLAKLRKIGYFEICEQIEGKVISEVNQIFPYIFEDRQTKWIGTIRPKNTNLHC